MGGIRRSTNGPFQRINHFRSDRDIHYGNMRDMGPLKEVVARVHPHEVYNLAAQSDVGISFQCPDETMEVNYHGLGRLVHAIMEIDSSARIYQASTSEMFGKTKPPQNETSPMCPVSPYGESKLFAHRDFVEGYRDQHGLFITSGILFNHESPRRGEHFVTRKITISLSKIKLGLQDVLEFGNLDAKRDWGFAGDYVDAMWRMLQRETPRDYIISTGVTHTVRDFVDAAASALDMPITWEGKGLGEVGRDGNGKIVVRVNKEFYRPSEVHELQGDCTKAKTELDWESSTSFSELVRMMVEHDTAIIELKEKTARAISGEKC
ncbi:MAG: GDP-mannose 4,6-dehydratase [Candidatus Paceibacterota bacterium]